MRRAITARAIICHYHRERAFSAFSRGEGRDEVATAIVEDASRNERFSGECYKATPSILGKGDGSICAHWERIGFIQNNEHAITFTHELRTIIGECLPPGSIRGDKPSALITKEPDAHIRTINALAFFRNI